MYFGGFLLLFLRSHESTSLAEKFRILRIQNSEKSFFLNLRILTFSSLYSGKKIQKQLFDLPYIMTTA